MTTYTPQTVIVRSVETNGLGTAGFVLSIVGWFTCGLLCPIGLLFSFIGLFRKPRGLAIAGTIMGLIGSAIPVIVVVFVGLGTTNAWLRSSKAMHMEADRALMVAAMEQAKGGIQDWFRDHDGTLPTDLDGEAAIEIALADGMFADWNVTYAQLGQDVYVLTLDHDNEYMSMRMSWEFDADTGVVTRESLKSSSRD